MAGPSSSSPALYEVVAESATGWARAGVRVPLSRAHARRPHPDAALEASARHVFAERCAGNTMLFNGKKFRMAGATTLTAGCVEIHCAITDYASYLGTNWNPAFAGVDQVHLADPLGVGCVVVTVDDKICLIRRSEHVGEYPLCLDAPGGHPEPKNVEGCDSDAAWGERVVSGDAGGGGDGEADRVESEVMSASAVSLSERVVDEFFDSMLQEIKDECGIPKSSLSDLVLMGIIRQNGASRGRPSLVFRVKCGLTSKQIVELYPSAVEAFETTSLEFRDLSTSLFKLREEEVAEMTPGCVACIEMWQRSMALQ